MDRSHTKFTHAWMIRTVIGILDDLAELPPPRRRETLTAMRRILKSSMRKHRKNSK